MSLINQFLTKPEEADSPHPLIRKWGGLLNERAGEARCRVERRRQGLTYLPTKLWLELTLKTGKQKEEWSEWDAELNQWLVEQKVKAINPENEAVRFQLMLRELVQKVEVRLGDGYFSAVFIDVLRDTGLAGDPRINTTLSKIAQSEPLRGVRTYSTAVDSIKAALSACAQALKELGYDDQAVLNILVWSVVHYLDDRFSVTNRGILGLG